MANSGYKGYNTLEEYFVDNGQPTGVYKPNVSSDPNYVAPVYDTTACDPFNNYIAIDPVEVECDFLAQNIIFPVDSDYQEWSTVSNDSWISITAGMGSGSGQITVRTTKNLTGVVRMGSAFIYAGNDIYIAAIYINQLTE